MIPAFLLALREGLEAALVIGMVLGVLNKLKHTELNQKVWLGLLAGLVVSAVIAAGLTIFGMEFEGRGEQIFEGSAMLLAAGVLTWMILWVQRGAKFKQELEFRTQAAVGAAGNGLLAIAFLAVVREGVELAFFLLAVEKTTSPLQTLAGALTGLTGAAALGWLLFNSSRRLSVGGFFKVTNILLIIFAAGLVAMGVHEFNEAGLIPTLVDPLWNLNGLLSDQSELGLLLKALFGYHAAPALTEVIAYLTYLTGAAALTFARSQKPATPAVRAAN